MNAGFKPWLGRWVFLQEVTMDEGNTACDLAVVDVGPGFYGFGSFGRIGITGS